MKEHDIIASILIASSARGARLFRNNVGTGWVGKVTRKADSLTILQPRPLHAGLCKGSSDIIGWTPVTITEEMVGKTLGVFTAFEVKTQGVATTKEQRQFVTIAHASGCIAEVVFSADEALALLP